MKNLVDTSPRELIEGVSIGPLGYGCWRLVNMTVTAARTRIELALENGMILIDTADVYGLDWGGKAFGSAEDLLGQVFKDAPELRSQMVLASKGGIVPGVPYNSASLEEACEASLKRLGVEQLDLYQVHRPDLLTHPSETARILENLRTSGKVRAFGVSNYLPSQTQALMTHLPDGIVSQQPEYSVLSLKPLFDGTLDQCMAFNQLVLAWSPLAGGKLATEDGLSPELAKVLRTLADRESVDLASICLAFVLAHPSRPVALIGSIDPYHIAASAAALRVNLDRTDVYRIIEASLGEPLP